MNYYTEQLENLKINESNFNPKIKIFANGNGKDTNFLDINEESATALIEWLQKNYINKP
jgi:hypothetical protein